jgi:hypothetical protein
MPDVDDMRKGLLGFGGIGLAMRRRRRNTALMQIA